MVKYVIIFSYDGSYFQGFQRQKKGLTIQQEIEEVLTKINGCRKVIIVGSGRTDAKVHALNQVAHFVLDKEIDPSVLKKSLNKLLNSAIYIKKVEKVDESFHARYDVISKEYCYVINCGEFNPMMRNYVYQYQRKINVNLLKKALKQFVGTHNFKSFTSGNNEQSNYVRTIYKASIKINKDEVVIRLVGDGFLRYMVRIIVGTLLEINEGKKSVNEIENILKKENRIYAGKTASPEGLYLKKVNYLRKSIK